MRDRVLLDFGSAGGPVTVDLGAAGMTLATAADRTVLVAAAGQAAAFEEVVGRVRRQR